ncbi:MAG: uracil-DNA glycosylase [Gemmatimonadota bacterium]|nr:uracil-DNA glycosylase [Gemmatimonadota bacterium]
MSAGELRPEDVARYLRDQKDLGVSELILEELSREAALDLAGRREGSSASDLQASGQRSRPLESSTDGSVASGGGSESEVDIEAATDLAALAELVAACTRCSLHLKRKSAVFGEGAADARVVCVGEAPGAREDETGRPFVGRAGQLLDRLLMTVGLARESVYICNVLKSRPPNNRDPLPDEVQACSPYLLRQLALIQPEVIVAFGAFAARTLLDTKSALGRMRGSVHKYAGYPVVVTYHPAALLRNPGWTRPTWEDLQIVRRLLDGEPADG